MVTKNVVKSAVVLLVLLTLTVVAILYIRKCFVKYHSGMLNKRMIGLALFFVLISFLSIGLFGDYIYPFERKIHPTLIAVLELPEDKMLEHPGDKFWHGAYEAYGFYAESFYFDPYGEHPKYGLDWPSMDFEHYSYIITYGQEIKVLTYNVWDMIDAPLRTGAKAGHMILEEKFSPEKVYIYRIPKLRIENDINNTCSGGQAGGQGDGSIVP